MGSTILPVLFVLPLLTFARIQIDVTMNRNDPENSIRISGNTKEAITEQDIQEFNLNDDILKDAIQIYFGERPDEVYTRSPTPYGDLYTIFGWHQVTKMTRPIGAKILSITTQTEVISTKIYRNRNEIDSKFELPISHQVQNVMMSKWAMNMNNSMDENILYSFDVKTSSMADNNMMKHVRQFGKNIIVLEPVTVGSKSNMMISLSPNQRIIAELYANKETVSIQVDYVTRLMGSVAMSYNNGFRGHKFWSADVNAVMPSTKMSMAQASEMLQITYYTEPKMVIRSYNTNEVMYSIPMMIY